MLECGVDISTHHSKAVTELTSQVFDYVITVCDRAKDACPVWPDGATVLHWSVEDPAAATSPGEGRSLFRTVRDGIRGLVEEFLRSVSTAR